MKSIQENMNELQGQLRIGTIQKAYKALLDYMLDLRTHFKSRYPSLLNFGALSGIHGYDLLRHHSAVTQAA